MKKLFNPITICMAICALFLVKNAGAGGVHYDEASSSYVSGNGTVAGDMTFGAATHLKLPLHNDPTTPTIGFGDFDTGLFELSDGQLAVSVEGLTRFTFGTASLIGAMTTAGAIMNEATSGTNPTLLPSRSDVNSGIGGDNSDAVFIVAGGVQAFEVRESQDDSLVTVNGGFKIAGKSSDPCSDSTNYPAGTLFWNTSGFHCYCNGSGVDVRSNDNANAIPSIACF